MVSITGQDYDAGSSSHILRGLLAPATLVGYRLSSIDFVTFKVLNMAINRDFYS